MWFRVDDTFHSHPKVFAASPAALGLWVVAGSWSSGARTGGVIPRHALARLLPGAEQLADELVVAGLWEVGPAGGYRFHDWADCNPSAEEAQAAKAKQGTAGKLGNHRRWHVARGQVDPSCAWCTDPYITDRPTDQTPDRVPDRSTDRGRESGGESTRRRPDADRVPAGAGASIGSDRVPAPNPVGSGATATGDLHTPDGAPDRVPDGDPESGANPPSRPDPSRPDPSSTPTSVGGVGEAAADASETDQPPLPAEYTDPITDPDKPKAAPRGTRIPDDFEITDAMRTWASKSAPSCGWSDHESFVDYWRGVPGARGRKLDWVATWRNWMRREHQRHLGGGGSRYPAPAPAGRSVTSERAEGWLALGLGDAQGTPHGSQMALPAATAQEVSPWHSA